MEKRGIHASLGLGFKFEGWEHEKDSILEIRKDSKTHIIFLQVLPQKNERIPKT